MNSSNRVPLIAAAVVVVAVVAGTFVLRGRDGAVPSDDGVAVDGGSAQPPVDALPPVPAGQRAAEPVSRDRIQEQMLDHVERRTQMRREHDARTKALREQSEQRFASEQVDPAWAPQKTAELKGLANDPGFEVADAQPQNLSVDCRSSMCRIDGQFETSGKAEDWILMYMSSAGTAMPNAVVSRSRNADGSMRVEIYGRAR